VAEFISDPGLIFGVYYSSRRYRAASGYARGEKLDNNVIASSRYRFKLDVQSCLMTFARYTPVGCGLRSAVVYCHEFSDNKA